MSRAQNRHDTAKHKKKKHPASKCGNAKCTICHSDKVIGIPDRQVRRANDIFNQSKNNV